MSKLLLLLGLLLLVFVGVASLTYALPLIVADALRVEAIEELMQWMVERRL